MAADPLERRRLLLVDAHGLAFRAYHALPEMTNRRGERIRVAYGYTSMLLLAMARGFDCAVAAFDPPGPTFRDAKLATYKGTRQPTPDELIAQIPACQQITESLNIPVLTVPGFEADDVLGTLARQARAAGCQTVILSGDMDLLQLVDETTVVQGPGRGGGEPIIYSVEAVRERFGFDPIRIIDFKALRGDASDNIPGVPGIGEKTATGLIQQFGSLDAVLEAIESMPAGRVRSALLGNEELARFGREMVTIVQEVPGVELDLNGCRIQEYDREAAAALLEELGMPSLVSRLPSSAAPAADPERPSAAPAQVIHATADLTQMLAALEAARSFTVEVAVEGPPRKGNVVGIALATDAEHSWYCPLGSAQPDSLGWDQLGPLLRLLATPGTSKSSYQLKEAILALSAAGCELEGGQFDCVLAAYLADSRSRTPTLAALCREWGGPPAPERELYLGKGAAARPASALSVVEAAQLYGAEAACAAAIQPHLEARLEQLGAAALLRDLELPVLRILAEMEALGVRLDAAQLRAISSALTVQIQELEAEMFRLAGRPFSPGSTPQLAVLLYDELGLKSSRRTKTGRSTDAQALESLREEHPIVSLLLEWRQVTKLKSTYVDALPELVDADDGRVHTSFNQAVAATGRLSSSDPNLQNIPIRTELGRRIRAAFIPGPENWVLVSADYSQIELRVLAHLSGDAHLAAAFARGDDVHADTAAQVFGVSPGQVSPEQRRMAKVVNFGILYGLSSYGLSRDLGIAVEVADDFIRRYFATYSGVQTYLESVREEARRRGFVSTILGRRRYLSDINSSNRQVREASERMAINMPIQGSAADVMKLGMIHTAQALRAAKIQARMLLQVHDELVFECSPAAVAEVAELAVTGMAGAIELSVPLVVDLKSGPNWRDLRPLERASS
ncbi:MAG TPA: DNA polymerase I [Candidatus Dormibacteraeota bacterium]|nr:DNA polymerase I [Candidatus Dormibacteraeota bacterium]